MDDSNSVVPSGAYGIPKWIMKKGMRYEVDDFVVSPPSHDDGGFLRLRYGRACTNESSLQGAGQDGGMTVEVKDDTLQFSSDITPTSTTISFGPGGLSVESSPTSATTVTISPGGLSVESTPTSTPLTTPDTKVENPDVHPLLVLPMNFGGASAAPKEAAKEASTKGLENIETHNTSTLLEKVQSLSVATSPEVSVGSSPVTSPFTTPRTSPTLHRKLMGMTMEPQRKISAHSYFCTKQPQDNQGDTSLQRKLMSVTMDAQRKISAPGYYYGKQYQDNQGDLSGNSSFNQEVKSSVHVRQVDESSIPPHALDPKMMGQRRRQPKPKPSSLREMNFWAPTSM